MVEKAVVVAETGGAVAVADAVVSACPNPSLPGQLRNRHVRIVRSDRIAPKDPIVRKGMIGLSEVIARSEASALNTVRPRDISRFCCPVSQSQNISDWRRISRLSRDRDQGLPLRMQRHQSPLPQHSPKTSRYSRSQKRIITRRSRNLKTKPLTTEQKAQPRTRKSDRPNGIANKSVAMK
jgi:hypothetical protein